MPRRYAPISHSTSAGSRPNLIAKLPALVETAGREGDRHEALARDGKAHDTGADDCHATSYVAEHQGAAA
jgi:hypothetical protein